MLPHGLNAISALLGAALVAATLLDIVWTTMSLNQAGPVTRRVSRAIWTVLRRLSSRLGTRRMLTPPVR